MKQALYLAFSLKKLCLPLGYVSWKWKDFFFLSEKKRNQKETQGGFVYINALSEKVQLFIGLPEIVIDCIFLLRLSCTITSAAPRPSHQVSDSNIGEKFQLHGRGVTG